MLETAHDRSECDLCNADRGYKPINRYLDEIAIRCQKLSRLASHGTARPDEDVGTSIKQLAHCGQRFASIALTVSPQVVQAVVTQQAFTVDVLDSER